MARRRSGRGTRRVYADRRAAGEELAEALADYRGRDNVVVLALPRGGVPVAAPIARRLGAPLGVIEVRKLGAPGRPELAMGAVASVAGRVEVARNERVISQLGVDPDTFDAVRRREVSALARRTQRFGDTPDLAGQVVILVDDGLATGATMQAAVAVARSRSPAAVVVAVPVAAGQAVAALERLTDAVVCPSVPDHFFAVGESYRDFGQVSDAEVLRLLGRDRERDSDRDPD